MDYKKIRETKIHLSDLNLRMQIIEELQKETLERIKKTQDSCKHDLIFVNRKYENKAYDYLQYGKCLICGKSITLTPQNINSDTNEIVDDERIIDVAEKIEEWNFEYDCSQHRIEIEEAERVFNSLTNDADYLYSRDCIKSEIVEALKGLKGNAKIK